MLTPDEFGLSPRHHRINGPHELQEAHPTVCPNGHRLSGGRLIVGAYPCLCYSVTHPRSHRTWACSDCDGCWVWPPCAMHPEWQVWKGVA